jgi:hypothetical protein
MATKKMGSSSKTKDPTRSAAAKKMWRKRKKLAKRGRQNVSRMKDEVVRTSLARTKTEHEFYVSASEFLKLSHAAEKRGGKIHISEIELILLGIRS